ncbi:3-methyl-2-oxobutanoate hydroxymethyltransferase [Candidatus Bathyarchaeota archaeon RBG_13_46_16b]|nr:MAG: 3-methyl-2-oxobutanoate hydroxymethyltransferase [Candidatus Bathyarchaeota archaeon RBG_13_46_16b]
MGFQEEIKRKKDKEKIIVLTAYDFQIAKILDEMQIDLILVGDSLGMVVQGHPDTKHVTMRDMVYHTRAVARGARNTPIIGDLPINSCNTVDDALKNATKFLKAGASGVKIEGNKPQVVKALVKAGIPTMGHVGMLPQTAESYRLKGKTTEEAEKILQDAIELDAEGVFSIVLECIPQSLAKKITERVKTPTIGIGAGKYCDGQVLVINDMLGLDESFKPKFVRRYANLNAVVKNAVGKFKEEVFAGKYPDEEHTYH